MPPVVVLALVFVLFLLAVLLFRTALFSRPSQPVEPVPPLRVDKRLIAEHLGRLVQFETTSLDGPDPIDRGSYQAVQTFLGMQRALQVMYPLTHRTLALETIQDFSLLYTWPGSDESLKPILLMAHMDVVPVEAGSESAWTHPPFSGQVAEGFVWGRGTLDDKNNLVGILEAVETLLRGGFKPQRTIYLAFGHDEEIGGMRGARRMASLLRGRRVALESILDEGGAIITGLIPGISRPVGLVGVGEKVCISVELVAESAGGHSSMPEASTAIGILSRAIHRLETHPMPAHLESALPLYQHLGSELPFLSRVLFANPWLLGGLIKRQLSKTPASNAMLRTTAAATLISAGVKDNILPRLARAVVNCRVYPGETPKDVIDHFTRTIADPRVKVHWLGRDNKPQPVQKATAGGEVQPSGNGSGPRQMSDPGGPAFKLLSQTIHQVFPGVLVAPYLVAGATDTRHYADLSENIFRFSPLEIELAEMGGVHGVNERLSLDNCAKMVEFYIQWIKNNDCQPTPPQKEGLIAVETA